MSVAVSADWVPVAIGGAEAFELWEVIGTATGDATSGTAGILATFPSNDIWMPLFGDVNSNAPQTPGAANIRLGTTGRAFGGTGALVGPNAHFLFNFPRTLIRNGALGTWAMFIGAANVDLATYGCYGRAIRIQPSNLPPNWFSFLVAPP